MNQIFRDHFPFVLGGLIIGSIVLMVHRQTKWGKRLSKALFCLSCVYPCAIVALFLSRMKLGESYAYLIFGDVVAILLGSIAGIMLLIWIPLYVLGLKSQRGK